MESWLARRRASHLQTVMEGTYDPRRAARLTWTTSTRQRGRPDSDVSNTCLRRVNRWRPRISPNVRGRSGEQHSRFVSSGYYSLRCPTVPMRTVTRGANAIPIVGMSMTSVVIDVVQVTNQPRYVAGLRADGTSHRASVSAPRCVCGRRRTRPASTNRATKGTKQCQTH
jgi:hypothetical protein